MTIPFRRPDDVPEVLEGPWRIMSLNAANWAAQKLAEALGEIRAAEAHRDAWMAEVAEWFRAETAAARATAEKMDGLLGEWAIERREETGKATQRVVGGSVEAKQYQARAEVDDKDAALEWAMDEYATLNPEEFDRLAPHRLDVKALLGVVTVLDVPTRLIMSPCGCVVDVPAHGWPPDGESLCAIGRGVICPGCGDEALIGRWTETLPVAVNPEGHEVDGVTIRPAMVRAYVRVGTPPTVAVEADEAESA